MFEKQYEAQVGQNIRQDSASQKTENNQQQNIHYTQNKKIIFWLYLFLGATFVGVQIYLTSVNWQQMQTFNYSDNLYYANQVAFQWSNGFINDVKITNNAQCPSGYEDAFEYYWPGTSYGCYCPVDANSSFVLEGYCSAKLIQSKCVNIKSQQQKFAYLWKDKSHICIRRSKVSFFNEEKYNEKNKLCGNSKSLVVLPNNQPCPLVNISFSLPTLQENFRILQDPNNILQPLYASYNSTSPYSFYGYPISKFMVSEHQFCLIDQDSGITPQHVQFKLVNYQKSCTNTSNFQLLDTIKQSQFYLNNPSLNSLTEKTGFPRPGNWKYKLGFSNLPSWNYYCRHNYDSKFTVPRAIQIFNFDFFQQYYYIALVQVILCCIIGFTIFVLGFRRIMKKQIYPIGYRKQYLPIDFCASIIRYIIDFSCKLTLIGLIVFTTYTSIINWDWFKAAINLQCTDNHDQMRTFVIQPFRNMYTESVKYTLAQLSVVLVVIIIDLVHFNYVYKYQLKYYLVENNQLRLIKHETQQNLKELQKSKYDLEKQIVDVEDDNDNKSDKFRITMALNIYDNEAGYDKPSSPIKSKPLKGKKKKKGLLKKKQATNDLVSLDVSNEFNPYSLDDDNTLIGLNSRDQIVSSNRNYDNSLIVNDEDEQNISRPIKKKQTKKKR